MNLKPLSSLRFILVGFVCVAWGFALAHGQTALPSARVGVAYSFKITTNPSAVAGTVYTATGLPTGLSINSSSGVISGTPTTAGTTTGVLALTAASVTNNFPYSLRVDPALGAPVVSSAATASATVGTAFAYQITATNSPTSFNVGGTLPPGLSFTSPMITGTPTAAGTYQIPLSANNATGTGAATLLTLTVNPAGPVPAITSGTSPPAPVGVPYTYTVTANNSPLSFRAVGLPLGLVIDTTTGVISGTPTIPGAYTVALSAANNNGTGATTNLLLTVGSLSIITSGAELSGFANQPLAPFQLTASNAPTSFNVLGLPPGVRVDAITGAITGTPTATGRFTVAVSANNATGTGPGSALTITVAPAPGGGGGGTVPPVTPPIVTAHPASVAVTAGASVTFTVEAAGTEPLTYQWMKGEAPMAGATSRQLILTNVTSADAGQYVVIIQNAAGSARSNGATLTVSAIVTPPVITRQPVAQSGVVGGSASFTVAVTSATAVTYQWSRDGAAIAGATSAALALDNLTMASAGRYSVAVTNSAGTTTSEAALLTIAPVAAPPVITVQPSSQQVPYGSEVILSVMANGTAPLTYQWHKDGLALAGATDSSLVLRSVALSASGTYTVQVTNPVGSVTSEPATLAVAAEPRLLNLSTRGLVAPGDRALIAGFVIRGTAPKPVLIRAIGPVLGTFGVAGAVTDPVLDLFAGSTLQMSDDNWGRSASAAAIAQTATRVGAFALDQASTDAAILVTLEPGNYTAQVRGAGSATGVGLVEIYDAGDAGTPTKLINVATRGEVGAGDNILIAGFYIGGDQPKQVLVRAAGPALAAFGLENTLSDPLLQLFSGTTLLHQNDNWTTPSGAAAANPGEITNAITRTGAFGFTSGSRDAAILVTLSPGLYSAQVSGVGGATGLAMVEVYEVP